jgi:hypothetical protein
VPPAAVSVDRDGLHFDVAFHGSGEVYFGDHYGWSFTTDKAPGETLAWPRTLQRLLGGWSDVRVAAAGELLFAGRVVFDGGEREFELVDPNTGARMVVDKWGLLQRPFAGRESVVGELADEALEILQVLREECGLEGWIAFGTLLGAVRDGTAIGHDSDLDLSYLSEEPTPAAMTLELWRIGRALRRAGKEVVHKSGSFLTVEVVTSDGVRVGIDLYATFFLDGWFYETATVRARLDRGDLLPLREIVFEGRAMPAPAAPERLLELSYGPRWRVPDPSFQYDVPRAVTERFDGWFSSLWRGRRDWRAYNYALLTQEAPASGFADWVADATPAEARILDVGGGAGLDAMRLRERGFEVWVLDYGIPPQRRTEGLRRLTLNLYDMRDLLARGAALARSGKPQVVMARHLVETLDRQGRDNLFRLAGMVLRSGGRLHLESVTVDRAGPWTLTPAGGSGPVTGGRVWPVRPADVADLAARHGARIVTTHPGDPVTMGRRSVPSWRMTLAWTGQGKETAR